MRPLSRPSVAAESVPHSGCISSVTSHFRHGFLSHPRFFSLLAASVALWQNVVFAQSQDPPSFRTESDVVLVDLVVTDREGNFVSDLKPDEIQLYENGERQVISFLQHRGRKPRQPTAVKEIVPTLSDGTLKNPSLSQRRDDRYYVFLLDLDTIAHQDLKRVRESIRRFLEAGLTSDDRVMIASLSRGLHVRQNFTSSVPSLMHTLEKLRANPSGVGSFAHFIEEMEELFSRVPPFDLTPQPLRTLPSVVESLVSASVARGRSFLVNLDQQVNTAAASLVALSTRLRSLPGRKQLIFFSGGYPLDAGSVVSRIIEDRAAAIYPNRTPIMLFVNRELRGLGYSSQPAAQAALRDRSVQPIPGLDIQHRQPGSVGSLRCQRPWFGLLQPILVCTCRDHRTSGVPYLAFSGHWGDARSWTATTWAREFGGPSKIDPNTILSASCPPPREGRALFTRSK